MCEIRSCLSRGILERLCHRRKTHFLIRWWKSGNSGKRESWQIIINDRHNSLIATDKELHLSIIFDSTLASPLSVVEPFSEVDFKTVVDQDLIHFSNRRGPFGRNGGICIRPVSRMKYTDAVLMVVRDLRMWIEIKKEVMEPEQHEHCRHMSGVLSPGHYWVQHLEALQTRRSSQAGVRCLWFGVSATKADIRSYQGVTPLEERRG
jgi:hypothetical protein